MTSKRPAQIPEPAPLSYPAPDSFHHPVPCALAQLLFLFQIEGLKPDRAPCACTNSVAEIVPLLSTSSALNCASRSRACSETSRPRGGARGFREDNRGKEPSGAHGRRSKPLLAACRERISDSVFLLSPAATEADYKLSFPAYRPYRLETMTLSNRLAVSCTYKHS